MVVSPVHGLIGPKYASEDHKKPSCRSLYLEENTYDISHLLALSAWQFRWTAYLSGGGASTPGPRVPRADFRFFKQIPYPRLSTAELSSFLFENWSMPYSTDVQHWTAVLRWQLIYICLNIYDMIIFICSNSLYFSNYFFFLFIFPSTKYSSVFFLFCFRHDDENKGEGNKNASQAASSQNAECRGYRRTRHDRK